MRPDIKPGGRFPDYELPDHTNTPRKLSEIQGEDPLILTLARVTNAPTTSSPSTFAWVHPVCGHTSSR